MDDTVEVPVDDTVEVPVDDTVEVPVEVAVVVNCVHLSLKINRFAPFMKP